jgi:predicted RNase H-like nuclease (RuvC/YqgF family)
MNKKILDFGELMEKLISENQKMKIKLDEYEKKDHYFKRQMHEVSKVHYCSSQIRRDIQDKKYSEIEKLASTIENFSVH